MNTLRMGVIAICLAGGASGYLSLRGAATDEAQSAHATRTQTANFAVSHQAVNVTAEHAPDARSLNTVGQPAFESDSADLLPPALTLDELLDAVIADIGSEDEQVDREALGELLRSDPELAQVLTY